LRPMRSATRPATKIQNALDQTKGHHKRRQHQKGALGNAELRLSERRNDGAHHANSQSDQKHLAQLMTELMQVLPDAVAIVVM